LIVLKKLANPIIDGTHIPTKIPSNLLPVNHKVIESKNEKSSFCYNGIFKTVTDKINSAKNQSIEIIDLYRDSYNRPRTKLIKRYQDLVRWSNRIYIISPVWWFRLTPRLEVFFDEVFTPGFAYKFQNITKTYAYPVPFLSKKKIRTYITHGAPAIPVLTLYLNSVKLRLVMGVYTFVFGWRFSLFTKTKQFWSVPFVSQKKREKYLKIVEKDIQNDLAFD